MFSAAVSVSVASRDYDGAPARVQISLKYHQSKPTLNHILAVAQAASIALTLQSFPSRGRSEAGV